MKLFQRHLKPTLLIVLLFYFNYKQTCDAQRMSTIESLLSFLKDGLIESGLESDDPAKPFRQYDFIIVGAGTAGCVLANRLSEVKEWNVLLLEAGNRENLVMDIPLTANYLQFSEANWKYKTMPSSTSCLGFNNRQCNWPRGKVMGGSSVLNYMIYTRGNKKDYDEWEYMGNKGWGYRDVLPYFKKIESYQIKEHNDPRYHGKEGYLDVDYSPYRTNVATSWVKSATELGYDMNDYNGKTQIGVDFLQLSMRNGTRHSSNRAYLHPIKGRTNLHVMKNSHVLSLLFGKTGQVNGVSFLKNGRIHKMLAKKEIILSAGAINSPQLLLLSGIGPKKDLKKLGIPVRKNLMVGYNLMDHIAAGGLTFVLDKQNTSLALDSILNEPQHIFNWMAHRNGPLTVPGGCEAILFLDSKNPNSKDGWPDIELLFIGGSVNADPTLKYNFGFRDDIYRQVYQKLGNRQSFMVFPMLLKPKSKGKITLLNRNPFTHPMIVPNYLTVKEDVDKIVHGIKEAIKIAQQPTLKSMGTKLYDNPIENCKHLGFGTDEYWGCHARHFTFTIYHQSGTCKMGPIADKMAVVDSRLKIHGVKGIRVIDASVIPEIPSAHTNAPTYMIAEKGADIIKQDWGKL